jgi:hypothetical protein
MILTGNWKRKTPEKISQDDYAIIKLSRFNNLPVVIMADKKNGGISVSYEDKHLDPDTKLKVEAEIQMIISQQFEEVKNADI